MIWVTQSGLALLFYFSPIVRDMESFFRFPPPPTLLQSKGLPILYYPINVIETSPGKVPSPKILQAGRPLKASIRRLAPDDPTPVPVPWHSPRRSAPRRP